MQFFIFFYENILKIFEIKYKLLNLKNFLLKKNII